MQLPKVTKPPQQLILTKSQENPSMLRLDDPRLVHTVAIVTLEEDVVVLILVAADSLDLVAVEVEVLPVVVVNQPMHEQ